MRAGGGWNHRGNLSDWVMFKDNHLTGLGNRRALTRMLDEVLPDARPEAPMCARFPRIELGICARMGDSTVTAGPRGRRREGAGVTGQRAATLPAMRFEVRATSFSSGPWPTARCHATARRPNTATCIQNQNPGCSS